MSSRIDIHREQNHSILENSANVAQMQVETTQNDIKKEIPFSAPSKMKLRAIQNSDLKPFKPQAVQKDTKKDFTVAAVTPPTMLDEKLPDSDDAHFFASQMQLYSTQSDAIASDFMSPSREMKLYEYQHTSFHKLNHIRKANRERLIQIAHSRALELSEMTKKQSDRDLLFSIIRGAAALIGVVQPDHIQKFVMGIGEAFGQLSFVQKTSLEAKKTPIQTQLDLLKGAEIPQMDEEQRNYARMVQELDARIQRLREMEMNTMHGIHQS